MKVLKIIIGIIGLIVILALVYLMILPDNYRLERRTTINATPEVVMNNISSFKKWESWSPWTAKDPAAKYTYEGPEAGVGAKMGWVTSLPPDNENQIGEGGITVIEQTDNESLVYDFAFYKPFEMNSKGGFSLKSDEDGNTVVIWYDEGKLSFFQRPMSKMMDIMMGPDFEAGLINLKTYCESMESETGANDFVIEEVEVEAYPYLAVTDSCSVDMVSAKLGEWYGAIMAHCGENGITPAGQPFAMYHSWDGSATRMTAGIPLSEATEGKDQIESGTMYAGSALKVTYVGPYEGTESAHMSINTYIEENGKEFAGAPWEVYVSDPGNEPDPNNYITEIYYPIK